ncbi:apical membrane antigen 1 [Plasmodium yoelii]|uniref:Apical membrane antigen 1 n=4 Tax=Plasmodium yoelii TaxID=5861 RepID=A0AAE9WVK9_PLAYO|nr:apical membrane antigen 1 [Plasmodium yoelii]EAA20928.1 apical membrane antigen-1 [Plasmodium yoelii yoelii]WBY57263.1 apical membrane antigen 1 [Plasmodium yoelii yoelii]CDU17939.1 apical membrane antigen 1 [Plasmodium yoelii]VTZ78356.1 apical membrane antigen 1 [Plasmodium yoelii]|eukprot:XP_729363.1 apical membrane antigen 1 [Plasmodium yoelii]
MKEIYYIFILCSIYLINLSYCSEGPNQVISEDGNINYESIPKENTERSIKLINPWDKYMEKYDIEKVHGSGIRVDLGEDARVENRDYRIPSGKCPVIGKGITIQNSEVSFLKPVATGDKPVRSGGLAFPETDVHISPITITNLKTMYKDHQDIVNLNDMSLCAKHTSLYVPGKDATSAYRHPVVYDKSNSTCYMLYVAAQENMGPRYCSNDANNENQPFCFTPEKIENYKDLSYLTKNLRDDWETSCPNKSIKNAKFGIWVDGYCTDYQKHVVHDSDSLLKCNQIIFNESASDQPKQYERHLEDATKIRQGIVERNGKLIGEALLPIGSYKSGQIKSHGKGYNWGNYDSKNNKCYIFETKPTCLINDKNFIATTALSSTEEFEENFPCEIYKNKIAEEIKVLNLNQNTSNGNNSIKFPRIFISTDKNSLNCPCDPTKLTESTCEFYVCSCVEQRQYIAENNDVIIKEEFIGDYENPKQKLLIIIVLIGVGIIIVILLVAYYFKSGKKGENYDRMGQADDYGKSKSRKDEMLDPEVSFWGEDKRASHTTPVLMEKPYY